MKALCFVVGFVVLLCVFTTGIFVANFLNSLPRLEKMKFAELRALTEKKVAAKFENKRGRLVWVPLNEVSRDFLYSVVVSEDSTFFEHDGVNYDAIVNSLAENIKERRPAFGGSTISQQVVKNLFLDSEKTVSRKVKEILITRELERHFTKNQILELYLNLAEFGPEIYGAGAAAHHFFGAHPSSINAAQGAFIALMLPSPKRYYYAVFENKNLSTVRRKRINRVLRDMLYLEFITEAEFRRYARYDFFSTVSRMPASRGRY